MIVDIFSLAVAVFVLLVMAQIIYFWPLALRFWQSKQGIFNVKLYGAKGDGQTDDSAAILQCLALAATYVREHDSGAELQFPYGGYLTSVRLGCYASAVRVVGKGGGREQWTHKGSWIAPTPDFPDNEYVIAFDCSHEQHALFGNELRDITIMRRRDDILAHTVHGVLWQVSKGIIDNVYVLEMSGRGLGIQGWNTDYKAYDSHITRSSFRKCGTHGIEFLGACSDIWFEQVKSEGNVNGSGLHGLGANCYYLACHFTGNKNNIRNTDGSTEAAFVICNMETPSQHNIDLTVDGGGVSRLRLLGCQIDCNRLDADNLWDAIHIERASGKNTCSCIIAGCTFAGSNKQVLPRHLIYLGPGAYQVVIDDNNWAKTVYRTAAIYYDAKAERCLVNGLGRNQGLDPNVAGPWFGYGEDGLRVLGEGDAIYSYGGDRWRK